VKAGVAKLAEMKDVLVEELAWQMGRPTRYGGEFGGVADRANYMSDIAASALAPMVAEHSDRFERRILREPVGVVFIIAPWNYPYLTTINTLAPALIAGNTVMLKHATQTLKVGERMAEAFHAAGVPADVFQNVVLDHETTEALIAARSFGFINFTGSVGGGTAIERAAAGTFTGLGLHHVPGQLWRALLEGIAFGIRHHVEVFAEIGMPATRVLASDGGSASAVWLQIIADVLDRTVQPLRGHPGSCLGAAWMAALGAGLTSDPRGAQAFVGLAPPIKPQSANRATYDAAYAEYRTLYGSLRPLFHAMGAAP